MQSTHNTVIDTFHSVLYCTYMLCNIVADFKPKKNALVPIVLGGTVWDYIICRVCWKNRARVGGKRVGLHGWGVGKRASVPGRLLHALYTGEMYVCQRGKGRTQE